MMQKYDYQRLMQRHYGSASSALLSMNKAINIYYPKRSNFIARNRLKSAIRIARRLKLKIKNQSGDKQ